MRDDLPSGTVTFLFTDVEGSTRLLGELGAEGYAEVLHAHRDVVRSVLAEHGGVEVDTQGDAFFCAFGSASAALACARDVQVRLAETPVRLRMGVHTGEALLSDGHYVGMDVHRGSRIGACGHGGQVVVSPSTFNLLEPGSFPLRELGEHRLKDLSAPLRLYQLGDGDFPPLRTLFRTNLPIPATDFVGRDDELRLLAERASEPGVRLLTLTGPGGTGKTRVALQLSGELAEGFPDGVFWAPLAPLRDPALVPSAVAQAVAVDERASEDLVAAVAQSLRSKRLLLLLDNCEHVLESAARLASELLASCPDVLLLTTSREPLAVAGENVWPVQPLLSEDAATLFEARARAAGAELERTEESRAAVDALCARLDHLPLAVELAAARSAALPPRALLERLSNRLDVLKGPRDADERQRTLAATIAWSHDLLSPAEQALFRRLSVFTGGATLEAAESVCDADLDDLLSLVAKSLVRRHGTVSDGPRYWMLETIREFAASTLRESGEEEAFRDRQLEWFASLARQASEELAGPRGRDWLDRLEQDRENLRAALRWALEGADGAPADARPSSPEAALSVSAALAPLHRHRGRLAEAESVLERALSLGPDPIGAAALESELGRVLRMRGSTADALAAHLRAERTLENVVARDDAWWDAWMDVELAQAHFHYFENELDALAALIEELGPVVELRGGAWRRLDLMHVKAQNTYRIERYALSEETEELAREIHRLSRELGDTDADFTLGFCLLWRGKLEEAQGSLQRGLEDARRHGDALMEVRCLVYGALAHRRRSDVEGARALLAELDALDDLMGYRGLASATRAWVALRDGDLDAAARDADTALADWERQARSGPTVFQWTARFPMLAVEHARGRVDAGLEHAARMLDLSQQPLPPQLADVLAEAVERHDGSLLGRAVELARPLGYA